MLNIFGGKKKKIVKAKLGDENNFYYNDELKRWVEKGKEAEAAADAPPAAPPVVAQPISQTVNATGIAAKYVDTGFGKPGEDKGATPKAIFTGKAAVQAPPPGMSFFVPQMPTQESEPAIDDGHNMENSTVEAGMVDTLGNAEKPIPSPRVKMGDPLEDFPGAFGEEQNISSDPLDDVFGTGLESKSSDDLSGTDPLDDIFGGDHLATKTLDPEDGSPVKDPTKAGQTNIFGEVEILAQTGVHRDLDPEGGSPNMFDHKGQQDFWQGAEVIQDLTSDSVLGHMNAADQDPGHDFPGTLESTPENLQMQNASDQDPTQEEKMPSYGVQYNDAESVKDPAGVRAYWDEAQTEQFYQWMDSMYGDAYKTWSNDDWSNFWVWYNNPEGHHQMEGTAVKSPEQENGIVNQMGEDQGGEENIDAEHVPSDTIAADPKTAPLNDESVKPYAELEMTIGAHDTHMNLDATGGLPENGTKDFFGAAEEVEPKDLDESKIGESLQWSDSGSPLANGVSSDSTSKSNISFSSTSFGHGIADADLLHLNGFFLQLSAVLKNLTPGSEEMAREQAECQDQMALLLKSMKKVNCVNHVNGVDISHEKEIELRDHEVEVQTLRNQLKGARNEAAALQSEMDSQARELEELRDEKRRGPASQKQARDWDVKCLREELEQTYHQQIYGLQEEINSKSAIIDRLQTSRASASVVDGSGGDLFKLRDELDNMEIAHRQVVSDIQTELDMRTLENENLREEVDRQSDVIASLQDQLEIDSHEYGAGEDISPRNGELKAQYEQVISHLQKELEASSVNLEDLDAKVKRFMTLNKDSNLRVQELEEALESAQNQKSSLEMELKAVREGSSEQHQNEESHTVAADIPSPEKFMLALGIADIQIGALSSKLLDAGVDVDSLISQSLAEYIEQQ